MFIENGTSLLHSGIGGLSKSSYGMCPSQNVTMLQFWANRHERTSASYKALRREPLLLVWGQLLAFSIRSIGKKKG
jgi:hypothetical protein